MDKFKITYHSWLKKIIDDFSKENKDKLHKISGSIKITSKKKRFKGMIEYDPDYCLEWNPTKKSSECIIFEFLDTESYEGIIADIVESACIKNCRMLLFLSEGIDKHNEATNIRKVICNFLDEINGENLLDVVNLHIPLGMDKEEIKDIIYKEINKRIKLPKQPFILGKSRLGGRATLS